MNSFDIIVYNKVMAQLFSRQEIKLMKEHRDDLRQALEHEEHDGKDNVVYLKDKNS